MSVLHEKMDYDEEQRNEFEALEAIFDTDFHGETHHHHHHHHHQCTLLIELNQSYYELMIDCRTIHHAAADDDDDFDCILLMNEIEPTHSLCVRSTLLCVLFVMTHCCCSF